MTGKVKVFACIWVFALVVALVFAGCVLSVPAGVAAADTTVAEATTASTWGNYDADSLWYFAADELNLAGLRSYVSGVLLPSLQSVQTEPVVIAVIDTGIDASNTVFNDVLLTDDNGNVRGYNAYNDSEGSGSTTDVQDVSDNKHGTVVSSIIAVLIHELGLEDYIKIYPIKASFSEKADDGGRSFTRASVLKGIQNAVSAGVDADVVNLSIASVSSSASAWAGDVAMQNAITSAASTATIVAAAGNEKRSSSGTLYYPAAYGSVVGVMASADDGVSHDKTNYGSAYDIFAPGEDILVSPSDGNYTLDSGTSMSAPIVSFAAALLRLSLAVKEVSTGEEMPRDTVITRLLTTLFDDAGEKTVTAPDGKAYKSLDILKLVSKDIYDNLDNAWSDVTGLGIAATRAGKSVDTSEEYAMTVRTLRETGAGRSYIEFAAQLAPVGDTDPSLAATVEWALVTYEKDKEGKEQESSVQPLGTGATVGVLFDKAGTFGVRASVTVTDSTGREQTFTDEFRTSVSWAEYMGSTAHIVTADYLESDAYIHGTGGNIASSVKLYGAGKSVTLTVTSIEDVDIAAVNWYVNGTLAGTGRTFEFAPSGMPGKDYSVRAQIVFSEESGQSAYVNGTFVVEHLSWAAHPLFAILWTALGVGVICAVVVVVRVVKKKKSAKAEAVAAEDAQDEPASPIRKK